MAVPAVSADGGLEVTTPFPAVVVAPGSTVTFDLTVSSTRDAVVDLALSGVPQGWTASLRGGGNVVDAVTAAPDTPGEVRLDVDVPVDAGAGTETIAITARGGGAADTLPVSVRVDAEAAGDISLTTSTPTLTGPSDATFSFDLQFRNDTPQDVTLSVTASGPTGWDVTPTLTGETQAASTVVQSGSTQNITVAVTAASDAEAGQYPISVEATAGERTAQADLGIEITGSYSATLSTPDDLLSASGSAGAATTMAFVVTNTGTAPMTNVTVTGTPPSGWTVVFDPETVASIAPNEVGTVTATITPSGEAVAGDYAVSFRSSSAEGASASASVRFTVETSPIWALVGLGLIVLILGGLFYVFRTYGRR
ncbi:MAG: NEW3 domain-containing protein [Chloroflexota bacterium]|nr:NEW3 domain-containing protein [Chloroflexota bacterium]